MTPVKYLQGGYDLLLKMNKEPVEKEQFVRIFKDEVFHTAVIAFLLGKGFDFDEIDSTSFGEESVENFVERLWDEVVK